MKIRNFALATAVVGLVGAPLAAADRQSAPIESEQELVGVSPVLLVLGAAALIAAIILIADDDDPVSP